MAKSTSEGAKIGPHFVANKANVWSKQTKFNGQIGIIGSETTLFIGAVWGLNCEKL